MGRIFNLLMCLWTAWIIHGVLFGPSDTNKRKENENIRIDRRRS